MTDSKQIKMSNLNANKLVYGTYRLPRNYSEFSEMLSACLNLGIEWIDTSPIYNHGISETWISNWEQDSNRRFKIATKAGKFYRQDFGLRVSNTYEDLAKSIEGSLKRLRRAKLELLFIHDFEEKRDREEIRNTLRFLLGNGLVQRIGLSNFPADISEYLINQGCVNHLQVNYWDLDAENKISLAKRSGIECWIYRPFNKGSVIKDNGKNPKEVIEDLMQKYLGCKILFGATKLNQLEWIKRM